MSLQAKPFFLAHYAYVTLPASIGYFSLLLGLAMRFLLLLISCAYLLPVSILAQTVTGRVVDNTTGKGIPGTTILQLGTLNGNINGTSSDSNGYFKLPIIGTVDSAKLAFFAINYVSQNQRLALGQTILIRLTQGLICYGEPRAEFALSSGLQYAPYGGIMKLNGSDINIPLAATLSYQSNFSRNHALNAGLILQAAWLHRFVTSQALAYEQLQALPANARFTSYRATMSMGNFYKVALLRQINFLVGGGYAHYQTLAAPEASTTSGFGYSLGVRKDYYINPLRLSGTIQATRWPGYWQYQVQLAYPISHGFQAGIALNKIKQYNELTALISYAL
jgi:hypothetical protein